VKYRYRLLSVYFSAFFSQSYSDATTVQLKDTSFPPSRFTAHSGVFRKTWGRVNAGARASSEVVVEPKRAGELLVNPASVTYKDGDDKRTTRLASEERVVVEDAIEHRRRTATHGSTWLVYSACAALIVALPYVRFTSTVSGLAAKRV
jgi:Translocon-associated protein beta (TRAPB)